MKNLDILDWIAFLLLIVGGINWGLIGFLNIDIVATIFSTMSFVSRIIYSLVGLSALFSIYTLSSKTN